MLRMPPGHFNYFACLLFLHLFIIFVNHFPNGTLTIMILLLPLSEEQNEDDVNDTDDDETKDDPENYCHLHQLFISRNSCLCTEMQRNFKTLCVGENMNENHTEFSGLCFQDVQDNNFPLFLTSRKFWVILDASLGSPYFFPRNEDRTLRTDFKNWLDEDSSNLFDMDIKDNDIGGNFQNFYEVTYNVFEKEFWNQIKYPVPGCHPTLIWTEIMSIIKGSYKSLLSKKGYLSKEEYLEIGKKQAPNFTSDREKVCKLEFISSHVYIRINSWQLDAAHPVIKYLR